MKTPRLTSWTDLAINAAGAMAAAGQLAVAWGWLAGDDAALRGGALTTLAAIIAAFAVAIARAFLDRTSAP